MNIFKRLLILALTIAFFGGCQKELNFSGDPSVGSLKNAVTGDCNPITINGFYQQDSTLGADNWVEVQVNTTFAGNFDIKSDTVHGISFERAGYVPTGLNTIRLLASGKPDTAMAMTFTVFYDTSFCTFTINVVASTVGAAHYILGGSPGACASFTPHGTYAVGTALDASDSITCLVNVTTPGTYTISTGAFVNGMKFVGSGSFANTGIYQVALYGSGTPTTATATSFSATGDGLTCTFSITPSSGISPALYTLGGSGGSCTSVTLAGNYMASVPTSSANTVTVDVNVTTTGSYSMSTTAMNGVKFSATGIFTVSGAQQVTLVADGGTPTASGTVTYLITGASTTCSFNINYAAAPPPAVFTLVGDPGACASPTVNGNYTVGVALNSSNTIVLQVNVGTAGIYTINTNTVGGMKFTASGVFTSIGPSTVTLTPTAGSNPTASGIKTLTPSGNSGATMCSFDINVGAAPTGILTCDINGTHTVFNFDAHASVTYFVFGTNETDLAITGRLLPVGQPSDGYNLYVSKPAGGNIPAMLYDENTFMNTGGAYSVSMNYYVDATSTYWSVADNTPFSPNLHFVINITTLNATNCIGTFFGTITENFGSGPGTKTIANGVFNVPVQ